MKVPVPVDLEIAALVQVPDGDLADFLATVARTGVLAAHPDMIAVLDRRVPGWRELLGAQRVMVNFRATDAERDAFDRAAARCGMTRTDWLREVALAAAGESHLLRDLERARKRAAKLAAAAERGR